MKNNIYETLKEDIITCQYQPKQILEEKFLTEKYNVSRTPIREIMNTLKQEGWLESNDNKKGLRVSQINLKGIKDLFQLRYELEPLILKLSFDNLDRKEFLKLKNNTIKYRDLKKLSKLVEQDTILHNHILNASRNEIAIKFLNNIMDQIRRIRYLTHENEEETLHSANDHLQIIECVLNDDLEKAQEILKSHIDRNQVYTIRNMIL